ncbi:SphA family protein [Marinobacterium marinum]|uniref:Transporter n=1 Tax=Marinobacterium marinum TaxID=2756129 RepID=A0A7W1WWM9_9GAMM|nr:transporter [Marinobacterium marinum]MBA4501595.1 transporter [Marinobacterium marinum]
MKKTVLASALATLLPLTATAGHYTPGVEAMRASIVPGPGVYYKGYAVHYKADTHSALPANSEVEVNALANRLIWVTDTQVLGGDLTFETIIPVIHTDLNIADGAVASREWGIGDIFFGTVLGWHGQGWDAVGGVGVWTETGQDDEPADPGLGYTETMLTLGGNVYLNDNQDLAFSALSRYSIADDSRDDEFLIEWGLSKQLSNGLELGLVGYDRWQVEGGDEQKHAVGASAGYFWPQSMMGLNLAAYNEYDADSDFEGYQLRATLTKVF